ncbi:MAG: DUF6748 domain-containing protein [Deltaproteobacteria bacterium]
MKTLLVAVVALGSACAADVGDDLAGESTTDDGVAGKADAATDGVYTYFQLHTASGGYSLARINRSTTVCANGATKASCTVPTLDWSEANLTAASSTKVTDAAGGAGVPAVVRGRFAKHGSAYRFVVTEAWLAESGSVASGVFAKITPSGVRCITTPCPTMKEHSLDNSYTANIAAIDWSLAQLSEREISAFDDEIASPFGTIIAGDRFSVSSSMKGRTATAAFHRVPADLPCYRGGCSGEVCSAQEGVITTCLWQPEYACDQAATCERQATGECGFTHDDAYNTCISGL